MAGRADSAVKTSRKQPEKLPHQRRHEAEARGDVLGFLEAMVDSDPTMTLVGEQMRRFNRLITRASPEDPVGFAEQVLDHCLTSQATLLLRSQYYLEQRIRMYDADWGPNSGFPFRPNWPRPSCRIW